MQLKKIKNLKADHLRVVSDISESKVELSIRISLWNRNNIQKNTLACQSGALIGWFSEKKWGLKISRHCRIQIRIKLGQNSGSGSKFKVFESTTLLFSISFYHFLFNPSASFSTVLTVTPTPSTTRNRKEALGSLAHLNNQTKGHTNNWKAECRGRGGEGPDRVYFSYPESSKWTQ